MSSRDDFKKTTRDTLAARAAMRCSNPSCRRATAKADPSDQENWLDLGIAAHITAASPGGPRYDPTLSSESRRSAANGLWLCHHCAKEVDSTASTYTVDNLRTWKLQAEACTARDAAATQDEIGRLVADIERVRGAIDEYVAERHATDPVYARQHARREDWDAYTNAIVNHSGQTQIGWDSRIAPVIRDILVRATGMLGSAHAAVAEAEDIAGYARTNLLGMKDMADGMDELRTHLLLR
jgi:hypothetical protein